MSISDENLEMIERARACGASAKLTGSGGAVVGTYEDEAMFARLERELTALGCRVFRPTMVASTDQTEVLV
jgi:glucuronokinase